MRTILLGTGSPPPNPRRRGPATLVTVGGSEHFLVDAGSGGRPPRSTTAGR
jgi:ribonuclease BN (tRNA processing enzyme)